MFRVACLPSVFVVQSICNEIPLLLVSKIAVSRWRESQSLGCCLSSHWCGQMRYVLSGSESMEIVRTFSGTCTCTARSSSLQNVRNSTRLGTRTRSTCRFKWTLSVFSSSIWQQLSLTWKTSNQWESSCQTFDWDERYNSFRERLSHFAIEDYAMRFRASRGEMRRPESTSLSTGFCVSFCLTTIFRSPETA